MYSITMLSLYFSFHSSLSPLSLARLPSPPSPPFLSRLKPSVILLSCCLDLYARFIPAEVPARPVVFLAISPIVSSHRPPAETTTVSFPRRLRGSMRDDSPLINHTRRVNLGITELLMILFSRVYTCHLLSRRERDDVVSLSRTDVAPPTRGTREMNFFSAPGVEEERESEGEEPGGLLINHACR